MASTDPFAQNVTFHTGDGTPFEVNVQEIDTFLQYCIQICTNYGAQLGASIVLFVILLLLTRPEKRSSSVFILNCAALLSNVGRLFCQILYFTTDFVRVYAYFSGDFSRVPTSAYANSVIAVVFYTILVICIEASLVLQVQVICANLGRVYRQILLSLSIVVALIPVGFRMAMMGENAIAIMAAESSIPLIWLQSAENITATISICFFCAIFVAKLGFAIRQRRRLGVRDFGPMKVIFIMGCQTLVIPATFSIIHYIAAVPALSSNVATLVTISLPLSSIWAGVALTKVSSGAGAGSGTGSGSSGRNLWNVLSFPVWDSRNTTSTTTTSSSTPTVNPVSTCYADNGSSKQCKQQTNTEEIGITVEHEISVQSFKREKDMV
ncbi:fungal pheromone mating factor STE2 GPCR-domain-containing protein [Aspergillus welwitschiae]|uniref:Fungal pheromone mating factor STE2 GPCR-domain-containing protein n=1 Tax=Aspergillus welwitschiae TaxID=1341132 RepID=A0A3F3Q101_9EURO|nr:fungal pheromone mating factor STE2 GPCR-domain-containing protein [Aspergillus welwitschiae]RDH32821.1 fungal pheromone mating factor STE2 GPCR-domain-containing protein [Aspergillus welwitschiae]